MKDFVSFFLVLVLITTFYTYLESKSLGVDYVVSRVDGKKYLVRNYEDKQEACDLLARMTRRLKYLVNNLESNMSEEDRKRLRKILMKMQYQKVVLGAHTHLIVLIRDLNWYFV